MKSLVPVLLLPSYFLLVFLVSTSTSLPLIILLPLLTVVIPSAIHVASDVVDRFRLRLAAVDLDDVLLRDALLGKKLQDVLPLITLKLDDHSVFGIVDNGAVAVELLLERFQDCIIEIA